MYAKETILTLKVPHPPDDETGEDFAYNSVKVIGPSPVSHAHKGDWTGQDAEGVILVPLSNFGGTLDEPFGKVRTLYDVTEVPIVEMVTEQRVRVVDGTTAAAGPTPEEVFAVEAPGIAPEPGQVRGRTLVSPLDDPGPKEGRSPLDTVVKVEPVLVVEPPATVIAP